MGDLGAAWLLALHLSLTPAAPGLSRRKRVLELVEAAHRSGRLRDHDAAHDLRALASSSGRERAQASA